MPSLPQYLDPPVARLDSEAASRFDATASERSWRTQLVYITTLILCLMGVPAFQLYWSLGLASIAWGIVLSVVIGLANLWLLHRTGNLNLCGHIGVATIFVLLVCDNVVTGGFDRPNFSWLYVVPMVAAVMLDLRGAWAWLGVTLTTIVAFWLLPVFGVHLESAVPAHLERGQALFSRVSAILALGLIATGFVVVNRRAKAEVERAYRVLALETKYVQLLQHAAVSSNEAGDLEEAIGRSVQRIVEVMGWHAGQAYTLSVDGQLLQTTRWIEAEPGDFEALREMTTDGFSVGQGLPGRALASRQPEFIVDTAAVDTERARLAQSLGIESAIAIPIIADGVVIAVLEFSSSSRLEVDSRLREVLSHVGTQIGRVAERVTLEARLRQSQKMEAVGQLAAGMAHEINNPMAYARSNMTQLRQTLDIDPADVGEGSRAKPPDEWRELIDESLEGIERTIEIVSQVRESAESAGGGGRLADLNEIVEGARQEVASRQAPSLRFICDFQGDLPALHCSPHQLHRTFVNLIVNAVQATCDDGKIEISTVQDGNWLSVSVVDDGPGIPEGHRDGLFDPFFTTRPVGEGTGLGLYVACEVVASHGGEIRVRSELGAGSRFEVRLPLERSDESESD